MKSSQERNELIRELKLFNIL